MGSKSTTTTSVKKTVYGNTKTSNPYAFSKTTNKGTVAGFQDGTAFNSVYDFVNKSIDSLLDEYLNPNLNSVTNQAKLNSFADNLNSQTRTNLENSIINPLSQRNMIRSSQATDLYKNLLNQNNAAISDFVGNLIANSQTDTEKMLSKLLSYYMLGANYLLNMQNHSLKASAGNATQYYNTTTSGNNNGSVLDAMLTTALMAAAGVPV